MIPRLCTNHPAFGLGLFLSKPGINALGSANPDDFLLHSSYKQEQILTAGHRSITAFASVHVPFAVALPTVPMVLFNFSRAGFGSFQLPYDAGVKSVPAALASLTVTAVPSTVGVTFSNGTQDFIQLYFIVMARSME